jgi:hypothetical protein
MPRSRSLSDLIRGNRTDVATARSEASGFASTQSQGQAASGGGGGDGGNDVAGSVLKSLGGGGTAAEGLEAADTIKKIKGIASLFGFGA